MEDDLYTIRRQIIETMLEHAGGRPIDEAVEAFLEDRSAAYGRVHRFMRSLAMEGVTDLSQLTVAAPPAPLARLLIAACQPP